jgi:hypothetical protein
MFSLNLWKISLKERKDDARWEEKKKQIKNESEIKRAREINEIHRP